MLKAIKILCMPFIVLFVFNFISFKYISNKFLKHAVTALSLIFSIYVVLKTFPVMEKYYHSIFCWIGLACLAILVIFSAYLGYQLLYKKIKVTEIKLNDKMFLFLLLSALSVSLKGLFDVVITCYGTFTLTAMIMPFIIFLIVYIPCRMPEALNQAWRSSVLYFLYNGNDRLSVL